MLSLQHLAGLRVLIDQVEDLLTEASASTRVVTVTDALLASLDADAEALPITFAAVRRLNAEEPYRLKLSFVRVRLQRTRDRLASGTPHEPGRDYRHLDELLADLTLIRDSMLANGDRLSADGAILRLIRTTTGDRPRAWPPSTSASTASVTTPRSPSSSTASASWTGPTPTSTARPERPTSPTRWPAVARWSVRSATTWPPRPPRSSTSSTPSGWPWTPTAATPWRPTSSR